MGNEGPYSHPFFLIVISFALLNQLITFCNCRKVCQNVIRALKKKLFDPYHTGMGQICLKGLKICKDV